MPSSKSFRDLRSRIRELRNHFLPKTFHPTGSYTERQFDRSRAFRLLAHAEIEWYLEQIASETANIAAENWQKHRQVTKPLLTMVAYVDTHLGGVPNPKQPGVLRDLDSRVEESRKRFNNYARARNNGIKEENILRLLLPVGISESNIDQTWLSTTDSFGQNRGETAHRSNQVSNPPDPKNEFDIVTQILEGLSAIDEKLLELRSR